MTFGRWLLVHSLSISILVMLGVGYVYKEELKLQEAYSQLLLIDTQSLSSSHEDKQHKTVKQAVIGNVNNEQKVAHSIIKNNGEKTSDVKQEEKVRVENPLSTEVKPVIKTTHGLPTFVEKEIEKDVDYLLNARKAYWDKDYQKAIELYQNEISKNPDSADLLGELGNIYYSLNNYDVASSHYLNAGELFLKTDDQVRAKQIYNILMSIAPDKAQLLLNLKNQQHQ